MIKLTQQQKDYPIESPCNRTSYIDLDTANEGIVQLKSKRENDIYRFVGYACIRCNRYHIAKHSKRK